MGFELKKFNIKNSIYKIICKVILSLTNYLFSIKIEVKHIPLFLICPTEDEKENKILINAMHFTKRFLIVLHCFLAFLQRYLALGVLLYQYSDFGLTIFVLQ